MFGEPEFSTFCGVGEMRGPSKGGNNGWEGVRGGGTRSQSSSVGQGWGAHFV